MCYAWFLSGYNYFNVVIDEKSAFNNARDCFQLFFLVEKICSLCFWRDEET